MTGIPRPAKKRPGDFFFFEYQRFFVINGGNNYFLRNRAFCPKSIKVCYNFTSTQVDYSKLWEHYKEKGHKNKTDLISLAGISTNILAKLNKGE